MNLSAKILVASIGILVFSLHSQTNSPSPLDQREKDLDRQILGLYQELTRAKELLSQEKVKSLPGNTAIAFVGVFPNRTGVKITKFNIEPDPKDKSKIKSSEEKSILLEFNGSVLSKVEISIINEDTQLEQKTRTLVKDTTPLDSNMNDMELSVVGFEGKNQFTVAELTNDDIKPERNNFKKDFYIKLLLDFHAQVSTVLAMQRTDSTAKQRKLFKELQTSLKY